MHRVMLDESLRSQLDRVADAELCDASGQTIGHFLSQEVYQRLLYDWANAQISDEELERRRRQPGGRSLEEIWRRLKAS